MMRLVKVYLMELFNQSRVERQLAKYAAAQIRRYRGEAIYRPLLVLLRLAGGAGAALRRRHRGHARLLWRDGRQRHDSDGGPGQSLLADWSAGSKTAG